MAVYSVAHHFREEVSLQQVESLLCKDKACEGAGMSLADLKSAIVSLGLRARGVQVTDESLDQIHCPSILYIRPERLTKNQGIGHFVVLLEVKTDVVRVVDLTQSPRPNDVPRDILFSEWDGECLEVSDGPFLIPTSQQWKVIGVMGIIAAGLIYWRRSVSTRGVTGLACSFLACWLVGCGRPAQIGPPISFAKAEYSAGTVPRGREVEVQCDLKVGGSPVVITSAKASCGCVTIGEGLVGQTLPQGSKPSLIAKFRTDGRFGKFAATIVLTTKPASEEPIRCKVSAIVEAPPEPIGTLPLRVVGVLDSLPEFDVALDYFRSDTAPSLEWDEQASHLAGFTIVRTDFTKEPYLESTGSLNGSGSRDQFRWRLLPPKNLKIGRHPFELQLAWTNSPYEPQRLPVEVEVQHPIRTSLDRVFLGVVHNGSSKTVDVQVTNWNIEKMGDLQVKSDSPAVVASLDRNQGIVKIQLAPSPPVGRLETQVRLSGQAGVPELVIPVTALVSEGQGRISTRSK